MNYLLRAQALGHDISELKKGKTIRSTVSVRTIDEFKSIFGGEATAEQRKAYSEQFAAARLGDFPGAMAIARLSEYVWGDRQLSPADAEFAESVFPLRIEAVSGQNVTISTDEVIGPGAVPFHVNAGTLTFAGGALTLFNTVLTVSADTLVVNSSGSTPYHIGIFGAAGAQGTTGSTGSSTSGQAKHGSDSSAPSPGICTGASDGGPGGAGAAGGRWNGRRRWKRPAVPPRDHHHR